MGKLLKADLKVIFTTKKYYIMLLGTVLTAMVSVVFIRLMAVQYQYLPPRCGGIAGGAGRM